MQYRNACENPLTTGPCPRTTTSLLDRSRHHRPSPSMPTPHPPSRLSRHMSQSRARNSTNNSRTPNTSSHRTLRILTPRPRIRLRHYGQAEVATAARYHCLHWSSSMPRTTVLRRMTRGLLIAGEAQCSPWWRMKTICLHHRRRTGGMLALCRIPARRAHTASKMRVQRHSISLGTARSPNRLLIAHPTDTRSRSRFAKRHQSDA